MKFPGPSAYQLLQTTEALFERVENLGLRVKPASKKAAKALDEAANKVAEAMDILKKEVDRRRALREQYERDLRKGSEL